MPDATSKLKLDKKKYKASNSRSWHTDRWVFDPRDFVEGITEGEFGAASALARWLDYEEKGLMETGYSRDSATPLFSTHELELVE